MEILDEDQQGLLLQAPLDQRARRQHDLALELLGLDVTGLRLSLQPEHVAQHRRDGVRLLVAGAERPEARRQLLPGDVQRVRRFHLIGFPEERPEDAVGRLAQGRAGRPADRRAGELARGIEPSQKLRDEPRLARPGLADQAHHLGPTPLHPAERGHQLIELVGPSDERRHEPESLEAAGRSGLGEHTDQAMDEDRLGLAPERQLAGRLEREAVPRERLGGFGHQDRSGTRRRQEPGRRVHGSPVTA